MSFTARRNAGAEQRPRRGTEGEGLMNSPEEILADARKRRYFGEISFKFQNGVITLVSKHETLLPEEAAQGIPIWA